MFNWQEDFTNHIVKEAVKRCVGVYGVEGTEQKAKELLKEMPEFKKKFLDTLYKLYKFGKRT